jgi:tripartite-type tricarboxylate transporter receptor subunit TctC
VKRLARLSLIMIVFALLPSTAAAQSYPSKPIRILVAWPAGGPADLRARQIAAKLSQAVGQPVLVENRPGASGTIGAVAAAKAAPDGYTVYYGTAYELAVSPAIDAALGYDAQRDFAPITQVVSAYLVLDARPGLGAKSIDD